MISTRKMAHVISRIMARPRTAAFRSAVLIAAGVGLGGQLTACSGDGVAAPSSHVPETTVGSIQVYPLNAVMAVGDTLSLRVSGKTLTGAPIAQFDSVEYLFPNPSDSLVVTVSASGLMTARAPSGVFSPVKIQVIGFKNGLARAEQSVIQVTETSIPGATLSIQLIPPDSAVVGINDQKYLTPVIQNEGTGQSVDYPTLRLEYGPGDSSKVMCYQPNFSETAVLTQSQLNLTGCGGSALATVGEQFNMIQPQGTGQVWVIAAVNVYGVALRDSVRFTFTNPVQQSIAFGNYGLDFTVTNASFTTYLAPWGTVNFSNTVRSAGGVSVDWVFHAPPGAVPVADILALKGGTRVSRQFVTPGTYDWTVTSTGGVAPYSTKTYQGKIIVQ